MAKQFEQDHHAAYQAATELLVTLDSLPLSRPEQRHQACLQTLLTFRSMGTTMEQAVARARGEPTPPPTPVEGGKPNPPTERRGPPDGPETAPPPSDPEQSDPNGLPLTGEHLH